MLGAFLWYVITRNDSEWERKGKQATFRGGVNNWWDIFYRHHAFEEGSLVDTNTVEIVFIYLHYLRDPKQARVTLLYDNILLLGNAYFYFGYQLALFNVVKQSDMTHKILAVFSEDRISPNSGKLASGTANSRGFKKDCALTSDTCHLIA